VKHDLVIGCSRFLASKGKKSERKAKDIKGQTANHFSHHSSSSMVHIETFYKTHLEKSTIYKKKTKEISYHFFYFFYS